MEWDEESICSRCEIADGALGQSDLELLDVDRAKEPLNKDCEEESDQACRCCEIYKSSEAMFSLTSSALSAPL